MPTIDAPSRATNSASPGRSKRLAAVAHSSASRRTNLNPLASLSAISAVSASASSVATRSISTRTLCGGDRALSLGDRCQLSELRPCRRAADDLCLQKAPVGELPGDHAHVLRAARRVAVVAARPPVEDVGDAVERPPLHDVEPPPEAGRAKLSKHRARRCARAPKPRALLVTDGDERVCEEQRVPAVGRLVDGDHVAMPPTDLGVAVAPVRRRRARAGIDHRVTVTYML